MSILFENSEINGMQLSNRFVRSATWEGLAADDGAYTPDYISMSRPFIREPGLVNRWASGDLSKATCLSDNLCRGPLMDGGGIYCVVEKQQKNKG